MIARLKLALTAPLPQFASMTVFPVFQATVEVHNARTEPKYWNKEATTFDRVETQVINDENVVLMGWLFRC